MVNEVNVLVNKETSSNPQLKIEDMQKIAHRSIDVAAWRKKFTGDDKENGDAFDESFDSLISVAFKEALVR